VVSGLKITRAAGESVASYPIQLSGASATNYEIGYQNAELVIDKAPLVITAQDISQKVGAKLPTTFKFDYSGFVNNETASVVTGLTATLSCGSCTKAGKYEIIPKGAVADNYDISYENGVFTLTSTSSNVVRESIAPSLRSLRTFDLLGRRD
jgi:hypothetical protein